MKAQQLKIDFIFTFIYALIHFVIDFTCVSVVVLCSSENINNITPETTLLLIVAYDLIAFALQMPIGAILDNINRNAKCGISACCLVMLGVVLSTINSTVFAIPAVVLVGIGNAIFHCAGGIDILNIAHGRASLPGVFIGTGAMGVFLATIFVGSTDISVISTVLTGILSLSICLLICLDIENNKHHYSHNEKFNVQKPSFILIFVLVCLFITVVIRSYAGMNMLFPWKADSLLALIAVISVVCGKAFGGFIADRIGFVQLSTISLSIASILFIFSWDVAACGVLACFLFNFTMPITLTVMANILPQAKGLAFGTATFALAIGFVPVVFGLTISSPIALSIFSVISLTFLGVGLKLYNQEANKIEKENIE